MNIKQESSLSSLITIVKKLRSPQGCPWDKDQNHDSLIPYFLEEVYEVVESIDEKNWESLEEELGYKLDIEEVKDKLKNDRASIFKMELINETTNSAERLVKKTSNYLP